jgi:hypothetical protein
VTALAHWSASPSYKAEVAWTHAQGQGPLPAPGKLSAPCPRCGKELRAGTDEAKAHERTALVGFFERDGLDVTAGFRCRVTRRDAHGAV